MTRLRVDGSWARYDGRTGLTTAVAVYVAVPTNDVVGAARRWLSKVSRDLRRRNCCRPALLAPKKHLPAASPAEIVASPALIVSVEAPWAPGKRCNEGAIRVTGSRTTDKAGRWSGPKRAQRPIGARGFIVGAKLRALSLDLTTRELLTAFPQHALEGLQERSALQVFRSSPTNSD